MSDLCTPSTTASSSSSLLGIYYDKVLLENLYPETRMYQLADKKPIPKKISKTITFTKMTKLSTAVAGTNLTEGVPPSPTWLSSTQITATIGQKGAYVPISDLLSMTAIDPVIEDAAAELGRQAATVIDKYLMYRCFGDEGSVVDAEQIFDTSNLDFSEIYPQHPTAADQGFSTVFFSQDGSILSCAALKSFLTSAGVTKREYGLTIDTVRRAVNQLKRTDVPTYKDGSYVMVIHPDSEYALMRDEEFKDWNQYSAAEKMYNGEVGKIAGCRFVTSSNVPQFAGAAFSSGSVDSTGVFNILLAPKGLAVTEIDGHIHMKIKPAGSAGSVDPLDQVSTVGWKWAGVAKVIDEARGRIVLTLK